MKTCQFVSILFLALFAHASSVGNKDVQRTIDASSSILKIFMEIKATDVDKEYQLVFPTSAAVKLAFLSVQHKGKSLVIAAPVAWVTYQFCIRESLVAKCHDTSNRIERSHDLDNSDAWNFYAIHVKCLWCIPDVIVLQSIWFDFSRRDGVNMIFWQQAVLSETEKCLVLPKELIFLQ